jgi:hypothetical protein
MKGMMMRYATMALIPLLVIGCSSKHEASTGKEFFEKSLKATKEKDGATLWKMMSKKTQEFMTKMMQDQIDNAKKSDENKKRMKDLYGIEGDPTTMKLEDLCIAMIQKQTEKDTKDLDKTKFIEEKKEGESVIVVIETDGKRAEMVLIKEEGSLKMDMDAMRKRNTK